MSPAPPVPPVSPSGLDPAQRLTLRGMLEEQRRFRIEQITRLDYAPNGRPLTDADREVVSAILQAARIALRDINEALHRMDDGTYGQCTTCGVQLRLERLEVLPQVALCMECQRAAAS
jgi:RNA polymerase-binding transcription factor DksA